MLTLRLWPLRRLGHSATRLILMAAAAGGGFGIFYATLAQKFPDDATWPWLLGVGGHGDHSPIWPFVGRFAGFFGGSMHFEHDADRVTFDR